MSADQFPAFLLDAQMTLPCMSFLHTSEANGIPDRCRKMYTCHASHLDVHGEGLSDLLKRACQCFLHVTKEAPCCCRRIVVEDTRVPHPEGGPDDLHWVRRMVFLSTRGLTQSEAYLAHRQPEASDPQVHDLSACHHNKHFMLEERRLHCMSSPVFT